MISISGLTFHFGGRTLYDDADLHIKPKDRIGLIGLNGTGKSTLLRLIVGEYKPDGGSISMAKDVTIGFLNQDLLSYQTSDSILLVAMQAFDRQMELQRQIDEILHKMETEYTDELVNKLARLQEEFDLLDGYTIQAKAEEILEGLGFTSDELHQPLQNFSGGWRMRVMLAKILLQKPSMLLLDEPTNHLDLPSIKWLESYLNSYEGAVIIVSHDRFFLDRTVSSIVEVTQQQDRFLAASNTETATPGYTLVHIGAGGDVTGNRKQTLFSVYFSTTNLFDIIYQSHQSRLKYLDRNNATGRVGVFNLGRNVSLKVVVPF
ncbi:MAG: ABC-F family ATP-binding cassette domain-containing protein [Cytophagaceae bacterium]|nr:MAG: ABC-F family ATP-binding cassette domain-containing protein [Cytophagaceae bacterium]